MTLPIYNYFAEKIWKQVIATSTKSNTDIIPLQGFDSYKQRNMKHINCGHVLYLWYLYMCMSYSL